LASFRRIRRQLKFADLNVSEATWRDGDMTYYPGGATDPDCCVLKFTARQGRYCSNFKSEDFNA
jgi:general stress protein 26